MDICVLLACMSVYHGFMYVWCPQRPEEDFGLSGTGITDYFGPPMGAGNWKSNRGPLQEKHVLLTS